MSARTPRGFRSHAANVGIKDQSLDFSVVASTVPCTSEAVFTRSRFAGPPVLVSREHRSMGPQRGVVTVSKNANVATGEPGLCDAREVVDRCAEALGVQPWELAVAGTGLIGRPWPMERLRPHLAGLKERMVTADHEAFEQVARAMMTTDTVPKLVSEPVGEATVVGVAKGVGMIEPDMATLLTYFFTDAEVEAGALSSVFRRVVDRTFNCLSIDTDTSTSDTGLILANGLAGPVPGGELEAALDRAARRLVHAIAADGEGATKVITVRVDRARDAEQARTVAKLVVNSPLVKTAVHGADPNWGRVAMAVGKAQQYEDIRPDRTVIRFWDHEVFPRACTDEDLAELGRLLTDASDVLVHVSLGTGEAECTVVGCDLSDGYVRINADYTT